MPRPRCPLLLLSLLPLLLAGIPAQSLPQSERSRRQTEADVQQELAAAVIVHRARFRVRMAEGAAARQWSRVDAAADGTTIDFRAGAGRTLEVRVVRPGAAKQERALALFRFSEQVPVASCEADDERFYGAPRADRNGVRYYSVPMTQRAASSGFTRRDEARRPLTEVTGPGASWPIEGRQVDVEVITYIAPPKR